MASKIIISVVICIAAVHSGLGFHVPVAHPLLAKAIVTQPVSYNIANNPASSHDEDIIQGLYSLIKTDGSRQTVHYVASPKHGVHTIVNKEPEGFEFRPQIPAISPLSYVNYPEPEIKTIEPVYSNPTITHVPVRSEPVFFKHPHHILHKPFLHKKRFAGRFINKAIRYKKRGLPVKLIRYYH